MLKRIGVALLPVVVMVLLSLAVEMLFRPAPLPLKLAAYPLLAVAAAALVYRFSAFCAGRFGVSCRPVLGDARGLAVGAAAGLVLSVLAAGLYGAFLAESADLRLFPEKLGIGMVGNIFPAVFEEAACRGGSVFLLRSFFGEPWAMLGGSVPFGLAHLASAFLGQPLCAMHVVGTTLAGLLLTLLYLRYGLFSCIACHWVWNTMFGSWARVFQIPKESANQIFEGAPTTVLLLAGACAVLLARMRKPAEDGPPPAAPVEP